MGFIIGCNICNHPKEIGEIPTDDLNKIIKEQPFETLNKRQDSKMSSYEVNKILTEMNVITSYDIEFPPDILTQNIGKNSGLKHEEINYSNGDTYQGTLNKNNKEEGYGTYTNKNGFKYKAIWKDDKITDYGIFIDPEGNYIKGTIVKGEINKGEMLIKNKFKYIGDVVNNIPNNKGIIYNFSGKYIYEGDFINGVMEGDGIIKYSDGTYYEGQFRNDKYQGKGKIVFKNGGSYEGDFNNNLIHGKGKYIYPGGKIYEGDFQNGMKHGFGKISWSENKYFEGFWINNRQHGEGKYYLNGRTLNAIFRYGKLIMKIG
jgi:hypothetical protein